VSFTRDELVSEIRSLADAENETRWTPTTVLRQLDVVFDEEWARILAADPYYRVSVLTPSIDANSRIAQSDLNSGSADSLERFYRVIGVVAGEAVFGPTDYSDNLLTITSGRNYETGTRIYWWQGQYLYLHPRPGDTATVSVNHRPQLPSQLADGDSVIEYPSPYEMILAHVTAARMLAKGGAESNASADLLTMADTIRDGLLADLSRKQTQPITWRYGDSRRDWMG
jgi:hypothetical protein